MISIEELQTILKGRRSVRQFEDKAISKDLIEQLIESASWAPSAGNRQDWFFTVITDPDTKKLLSDAVFQWWEKKRDENKKSGTIVELEKYYGFFGDFVEAPVLIVISGRVPNALEKHFLGELVKSTVGSVTSAAMAAQNLMLAAHVLGLGSCCMTGALAAEAELGKILNLGRKKEIVCLIKLGWPAKIPEPPQRKSLDNITRYIE